MDGIIWASKLEENCALGECATGWHFRFAIFFNNNDKFWRLPRPLKLIMLSRQSADLAWRFACRWPRPWCHLFSLQSHVREADRRRFNWTSEGNTRVVRSNSGRIKNVLPGCHLALFWTDMHFTAKVQNRWIQKFYYITQIKFLDLPILRYSLKLSNRNPFRCVAQVRRQKTTKHTKLSNTFLQQTGALSQAILSCFLAYNFQFIFNR